MQLVIGKSLKCKKAQYVFKLYYLRFISFSWKSFFKSLFMLIIDYKYFLSKKSCIKYIMIANISYFYLTTKWV